jgi:hypothetical protein
MKYAYRITSFLGIAIFATVAANLTLAGEKGSDQIAGSSLTYVNTQGEIISRPDGCTPETRIDENTVRVYQRSEADAKLFSEDLRMAGVTDAHLLDPQTILAENYTCDRKSAKECSDGTCKTGSCQSTTVGASTYCRCR